MRQQKTQSWKTMLGTIRAPIIILAVGGIALTVPPQMRDMLAFLDRDQRGGAIMFEIALFVFSASAWFWSRAALAARFGITDRARGRDANPHVDGIAFTWLPRLVLLAVFLIGIVIALESDSYWTVFGAILLGALSLLLAVFRPRNGHFMESRAPHFRPGAWLRGGWWLRLLVLLERAPGRTAVSATWLLIGLIPLALGLIEAFGPNLRIPNHAAVWFPGPSIAVLLLGLMIGPLAAMTFVVDGLRLRVRTHWFHLRLRFLPVMTILFIYIFVVVPSLCDIHTVRVISTSTKPQTLDDIFRQWAGVCAPGSGPIEPIIVAVSGGATRAGLWGAAVLDKVLDAEAPDRGPALFAVSSVSGGSLGVAGAMSVLSGEQKPCRARGLPSLVPQKQTSFTPLAGDALGPLLGGWLLNDIPRAFFDPIAALVRHITGNRPNGGDSAEAIEHAFEDLWARVDPSHQLHWDAPFLSLFYRPDGSYRAGMPLWFANGTDVGEGNRVITAPIRAPVDWNDQSPWPFRGARDLDTQLNGDVSISTAINNSARFPYLEPFGELLPIGAAHQVGSLVDGGYFENEGLQTALDLAGHLTEIGTNIGRAVLPIIIEATGDGATGVSTENVMTCTTNPDAAFVPDTQHGAAQLLAPIVGIYNVRGGHSAVLLRQTHDQYCPKNAPQSFFHFYLPAQNGRAVPLNWVLSNQTAARIWDSFADNPIANGEELKALQTRLQSP